jgi:peptidoglycan/xylan/chitin deacetylase (PgdA/CDA1 family)
MKTHLIKPICAVGWRLPLGRLVAPRRPVVLMYHGIPRRDAAEVDARALEVQMEFLKRHFEVVSPRDFFQKRAAAAPVRVAITFDDGYRNVAEVAAPVLQRLGIPALFFVCTRPSAPGKYLWFAYFEALRRHFSGTALRFRGQVWDLSEPNRRDTIQRLREYVLALRPHPAAMYEAIEKELPPIEEFVSPADLQDRYAGMTEAQIRTLAADPLFAFGVHTVDHPMLTFCSPDEMVRQIQENKSWIERVSGRPCEAIAYPRGDYNAEVVDACVRLGLKVGYAVTPTRKVSPPFEVPRIGIYRPSLDIVGFKVIYGQTLRALGVPLG